MRFLDEVEITCISGHGGSGMSSFRREPFVPRGGPDGGDGGRGGNVVLVACHRLNTLQHLRGRRVYSAKKGASGGTKKMTGACGEDWVVEVPVGTVVFELSEGTQIADLDVDGATAVVCRGGRGGRGNSHFKTSTNRTPRKSEPGGEAVELQVRLELKLLADVGLLGFPNAGKSTLISRISNARPKVADYPFTTLVPNLGVVSVGTEFSFVVADIPGLVAGASQGVGLGLQFLKHVERCSFLLHLVSVMEIGEALEDPLERYTALCGELESFSAELASRDQIVVLTKVDLLSAEELEEILARFELVLGHPPLVLSSVTGRGVDLLVQACGERLRSMLEEREGSEDESSG